MKNTESDNNRRNFIKKIGVSAAAVVLPIAGINAMSSLELTEKASTKSKTPVNFIFDGLDLSPEQYIERLSEINKAQAIEPDFYGEGGPTTALEEQFAKITGKEKAIYLPTGTMANQLAIKLLSGSNTKVLVPENSHVYRDEADAAQSVHAKRLIPVGEGKPYFELSDLKSTIDYLENNEVFRSGLGTVVIENPVRRADGRFVPIDELKEISKFCKENNLKMHLDGARIHLASAFSGVSISEYASYFDTVYISLYKYLNATGGAILCGNADTIDQLSHHIKILGGTVFQSWNNTSVALHYLNGIDGRLGEVVKTAQRLISELNKIDGIRIKPLKNGTNIFDFTLSEGISLKKLAIYLYDEHNIWLGRANEQGVVKFAVNESILTRAFSEILNAWKKGMEQARK